MCTVTQSIVSSVPSFYIDGNGNVRTSLDPTPVVWCPVRKDWVSVEKPRKVTWDADENLWRFMNREERLKAKHVKSKPPEQFFAKWTRQKSDDLRWGLLDDIGLGMYRRKKPVETCLEIPGVDWDDPLAWSLKFVAARALFSKDEDMWSEIDKEAVAFESFKLSEASCKAVNDSIRDGVFASDSDTAAIMFYAAEKIALILGDCPTVADIDLSFGPGASTSCSKRTTARWKLSSIPSITRSGVSIVSQLRDSMPHWFGLHENIAKVEDGRLEFVPKNFKTDRSINIEPTASGMQQKGIGKWLKRKLKSNGIDLSDQSINRKRAFTGSLDGSLSTLDLERASDSIAYLLVMELVPMDWFEFLDSCRTSVVQYKSEVIQLEKFSSMGNGYTFELESLIFYALCFGIARHNNIPCDLTIYGDDIVTSTQLGNAVQSNLGRFGLTVNPLKSFIDGPFRESCGGDYLLGLDVRPFFIKDRFSYHRVVCFYNFLVRKPWFDPECKLRTRLMAALPLEYRLYGPDGYGDGHLIDYLPGTMQPVRRDKGYSGYSFKTFVESPKKDKTDCLGDAVLPVYVAVRSDPMISDSRRIAIRYQILEERDQKLRPKEFESHMPDHFALRKSDGFPGVSTVSDVYVLDPFCYWEGAVTT